ncbi:MAG TPA: sigma 54-interacting transcriptional regulator [Spirochaetales bacterium]|nr:sigma 54-interacting transcriptional regulator [Spirochaetales bacterium]
MTEGPRLRPDWAALGQETRLAPEGTMDIVLESLRELVDYELAVVLSAEEGGRLTVRRARGPLATRRLAGFSISLAERRDLAALLAGLVPRLLDHDAEHLDTYAEILDLPDEHSCLAAPLVVDGEAIGLLTLDHRSCGVFSGQIVRFIGVISKLVALALVQSETSRSLRERNESLLAERNRLLERDSDVFRDLAGSSPAWLDAMNSVRLVASTDSPVLLLGETGTGKEEAARAIHRLSGRAGGPFVALNCSALPPALAESELFGHEKGSFTGAQGLRRGRFELAHGGTLFLDEIGDLPPEIQPKLLRAIQEGRFERVGGEKPVQVDARIVAATHVDLGAAVEAGRFREDLFYRVAVFPVRLPPLRERGDDAVAIAELFASRLRARPGWEGLSFSAEALAQIAARPWPGNVRELRNAVERAAILARGGLIGAAELCAGDWANGRPGPCATPGCCDGAFAAACADSPAGGGTGDGTEAGAKGGAPGGGTRHAGSATGSGSAETLEAAQKRHVERALERAGGKVYGPDGAAAALGLKPSTLQSRMKKLGIDAARFRLP